MAQLKNIGYSLNWHKLQMLTNPLLCVCGGFSSVVLLWPNEWHSLQQWYTSEDRQVCLLEVLIQDSIQYTSSPGESK